MNHCSDEKSEWWRFVYLWGGERTQGRKLLESNKRCISLVRDPSEEVVTLRRSQIDAVCSSTKR
jgi:hypothetical protein